MNNNQLMKITYVNIKKYVRAPIALFFLEISTILVLLTFGLYLTVVAVLLNFLFHFFNLGDVIELVFSAGLIRQVIFVVLVLGAYVAVAIPLVIKYIKWSNKVMKE